MREGLPGKGIWFAGEHTAPFVALGTVTGAYWSGESVAKRIAEAYCIAAADDVTTSRMGIQEVGSAKPGKEVEQDRNARAFADVVSEN